MAIEHVVDCTTGNAFDQDYGGELPVLPQDPGQARREEALRVLREVADRRRTVPQSVLARAVLTLLGEP